MIAGMIGKVLLRELPGYVAKQIVSRQAHVYGSVIYSPPQRRVLGYLQEAAPLALTRVALANPTTAPAAAAALVGKLGLCVIDTNKRVVGIEAGVGRLEKGLAGVHDKLDRMDHGLGRANAGVTTMNGLGLANLATSAFGIGLSAAGFDGVSAKVEGMKQSLDELAWAIEHLGGKLDQVRHDLIEADFAELRALGKAMDEGWRLADGGRAERQWHEVARGALSLQMRFDSRANHLLASPSGYLHADPMLDALALASGLRVAALAACNETVAAQDAAADGARTLERLTGGIGLADMVRHRVAEAGVQSGSTAWTVALAEASEEARPMVRKMREREAALATRAAPLPAIEQRGIAARDWLQAAREETEAPLLVMVEGEDEHSS
jgi:hypothetical protein